MHLRKSVSHKASSNVKKIVLWHMSLNLDIVVHCTSPQRSTMNQITSFVKSKFSFTDIYRYDVALK
jgi:hypothetical protein